MRCGGAAPDGEANMVQFDNQYRQVKIKIVYYGPALSGKTTCLEYLHRKVYPQQQTKLYSFNTANDRTLFFDLLGLDLGRIRGYRLALQLYTVPGQVQYNATRRAVLTGTDGIVFVADSQAGERQANIDSLENMWANLEANGIDRTGVPVVFQFNKRDLEPVLSIDEMNATLNPGGAPAFPSVAIRGEGVMEAFAAIAERTLMAVADKLGVGGKPAAEEQLRRQVAAAIRPFLGAPAGPEGNGVAVVKPAPEAGEGPLPDDKLVHEAVRANLEMTDLNLRLDTLRRELERKVRVLGGIAELGQRVGEELAPQAVLDELLRAATDLLDVGAAAVLLVADTGGLEEAATTGLDRDPVQGAVADTGEPLAAVVADAGEPRLVVPSDDDPLLGEVVEGAGFGSALLVPLRARGRLLGLLTAYRGADRNALDEADLQLAGVLASTAAVAYTSAVAWGELKRLNEDLEAQVAERTRALEQSLEDVQRLNAELESRKAEVEEAYRRLAELDRVKNELTIRIANDLRAPVRSVLTAAQLLDDMAGELPERARRYGAVIREKGRELEEIMENVLQASLLAAADEAVKSRPVAVRELLKAALGPVRGRAETRGIRLHVLIASGLEELHCEPDLLTAALRSVVKNAIDYNRDGGEVRVEVFGVDHSERAMTAIRVKDTGIGIPPEDLDRVFEPFWRGERSGGDGPAGAGLGLAVARRVVEAHGGSIALDSTPGEGTTVTIVLPRR